MIATDRQTGPCILVYRKKNKYHLGIADSLTYINTQTEYSLINVQE